MCADGVEVRRQVVEWNGGVVVRGPEGRAVERRVVSWSVVFLELIHAWDALCEHCICYCVHRSLS